MQILGDKRIVSATDLNDRLACRHLLHLNLERALGRLTAEQAGSSSGELLARKGDEHEASYLESLKELGRNVIELERPASGIEGLEAAAAATVDAMREGPDVIFQATFFDGESRGHTDFLFKVDRPSELGDFSYEVADTKLARSSKPYFIVQLCFYSELLEKVQGGGPPESIHVILGNRRQESFRLGDFAAYYRQLRGSFDDDLLSGVDASVPYPVAHCDICGWRELCGKELDDADHLSRVAGIRRDHVESLEASDITTLSALANLNPEEVVDGVRPEMLTKLRSQASLQVQTATGEPAFEVLPRREDRGFERLPTPSEGDLFFDFEGDPLYGDQGLEYLFGYVQIDNGTPEFEYLWARDSADERMAFEQFIDYVTHRRVDHSDLHIYHYAPYEVTALKRLASTHGTREFELDELLRAGVFVDLYKVVRESMRIGQPSYSIKKVEAYYRPDQNGRETSVADGGDSIVQFERWLETGDDEIKQAILEYNKDDCVSTLECRDWLLERRAEAAKQLCEEFAWFATEHEPSDEAQDRSQEHAALRDDLETGIPAEAADRDADEQARWLMARLVDYHQREARPAWWEYFDRLDYSDPDEFIDEAEAIGGLVEDSTVPPRQDKKSLVHRMRFEVQETKIGPGGVIDPDREKPGLTVTDLSVTEGWLDLKRGPKLAGAPLPHSLITGGPYNTGEQRGAVKRLAISIAEDGLEDAGEYRAGRDILRRTSPRVSGVVKGEPVVADPTDLAAFADAVKRMEETCLFVQGPPGAGKTYAGSHLIASLIADGHKVGVTSNSHKAIGNLLHAVEDVATERGLRFKGLKKSSEGKEFESHLTTPLVTNSKNNSDLADSSVLLTAGTAWYYCREDVAPVDYLFIDEAGQVSLADALALSTSARNVVLLGDPQQLAQVSLGSHPEGSGVSVLEHLLGDEQTIPSDRGVFLNETWRMHPDVTEFISELMYEGRLESAPGREIQGVTAFDEISGTGLRWRPVIHKNRRQRSPEEAEEVAGAVRNLLNGAPEYTDHDGEKHPLRLENIIVVSPYNAQVRCLKDALPEGARVGTVDKFQGQEAQVVIFSMATSSGTDIPRNLEFLFSRNRLNVAISRARCVAVLTASPQLLNVEAKSVEQMRLINALCRFVEMAEDELDRG